jgi:hypothetical protein
MGPSSFLPAAVAEIHGGGSRSRMVDLGQRRPNSLLSGPGKVAWRVLLVAVAEIQIQATTMDQRRHIQDDARPKSSPMQLRSRLMRASSFFCLF